MSENTDAAAQNMEKTQAPNEPPKLSGAALEDAKNCALLFFMDHLMTKSGRRTIHDLSCQFGARGFTEEMREAVGSTQEGLQAFLNQFPSLFTIEGDEVMINAYGDLMGGGTQAATGGVGQSVDSCGKARNAEQEAIEFFEIKLRKFGPELQIKSLLGHRSQAAPEVRLISGRHLKDFTEFLRDHPNNFIVQGDRVRLTKMPEPEDPALLLDSDGQPLTGQRAKQAAVDYLKQQLENNDDTPIPLDSMYQRFCERFPHAVRQDVATNPKELLQFLKLNRSVFFIRSNKVSLVKLKPEDATGAGLSPEAAVGGNSGDNSGSEATSEPMSGAEDRPQPVIVVVKSLRQAQIALNDLLNEDITIDNQPVLAVDCKFVSLGPQTPEFLSLVVIGTFRARLIVFDVAHSDTILLESGLRHILESPDVLKVMHDCRNTASTLQQRYGIQLCNVFDTQVAHTVIHHKKHDRPLHEIRPIVFNNLQRLYYPESLMTSQGNPSLKRVEVNWAHRPITDDSLQHICEQTLCLLPHVYTALKSALPSDALELFEKLCMARVSTINAHTEGLPPIKPSTMMPPEPVVMAATVPPSNGHVTTVADNKPKSVYVPPHKQKQQQNGMANGSGYGNAGQLITLPNIVSNGTQANTSVVATQKPPVSTATNVTSCCSCQCHGYSKPQSNNSMSTFRTLDVATQTLSTGDITIHKIHYESR